MKSIFIFLLIYYLPFPNLFIYASENSEKVQPIIPKNRITVFLDTGRWFDEDFVRQQIPFVVFVRNREQADVHIIATRHVAGSSGVNYAISFSGNRTFRGQNQELTYWAPSTNSSHETRYGYTNVVKIGLVPYLSQTSAINNLTVGFSEGQAELTETDISDDSVDPWKNWVFEIYGGGNFSKEEKLSSFSFRTGFFADRVTANWKIRFRPYFNFSTRTFLTSEGNIVSSTYRHGYQGYLIKSLNNHWSAGIFSSGMSSTFHNLKLNADLMPALEWSLYPYDEATRRSITLSYRVGCGYNNYFETTIFEKDHEWILGHALEASVMFQQTWGNIRAGLTGSHHLNDISKNRAQIYTSLNIRVFKGFSLNLYGNFEIINDMIAIPAGDLTLEEILLARSQQATSYSLSGSIGFSYTFGSSFSAAFNPRL